MSPGWLGRWDDVILVYTPVSLKIAQSEVVWLFRVSDCLTKELTATRSPVFYLPSGCRSWECWECSLSQGSDKRMASPSTAHDGFHAAGLTVLVCVWWGNACDVLPYLLSGCPLPSKYLSILGPRKEPVVTHHAHMQPLPEGSFCSAGS